MSCLWRLLKRSPSLFMHVCAGEQPCLGTYDARHDTYKWLTFAEVWNRAQSFVAGLAQLTGIGVPGRKVGPTSPEFVGIWSLNRSEVCFIFVYTACTYFHSCFTYRFYSTLIINLRSSLLSISHWFLSSSKKLFFYILIFRTLIRGSALNISCSLLHEFCGEQ